MQKIALVYSPGSNLDLTLPPIGIAYLYSYLKTHGYQAEIFDFNLEFETIVKVKNLKNDLTRLIDMQRTTDFYRPNVLADYYFLKHLNDASLESLIRNRKDYRNIKMVVKEGSLILQFLYASLKKLFPFQVVGFSVIFNSQIRATDLMIRALRLIRPGIRIAAGGPAAAKLRTVERLDILIKGDGEKPLYDYLVSIDAGKFGKRYKEKNGTGEISCFDEIDNLPPPDFTPLFEKYRYMAPHKIIPLAVTRGCYWSKCQFCSYGWHDRKASRSTAKYRKDGIEKAISDITHLKDKHQTIFFFFSVDAVDPVFLEKLADSLLDKSLKIFWQVEIRAEKAFLKEGFLEKLYNAGCRAISFGLESVNQRVLDAMGKGVKTEIAKKLVDALYRAGIAVNLDFFIGYPSETPLEARETQSFVLNKRQDMPLALGGVFQVLPESKVADSGRKGKIEDLKFFPGNRGGKWKKKGMDWKETKQQLHICHVNALCDWNGKMFPGRQDSAHFLLYSTHHTLKGLVHKIQPDSENPVGLNLRALFLFPLTFHYASGFVNKLDYGKFYPAYSDIIGKISTNEPGKREVLNLCHEIVLRFIKSLKLKDKSKHVLKEIARFDYFLVLSCLGDKEIPVINGKDYSLSTNRSTAERSNNVEQTSERIERIFS